MKKALIVVSFLCVIVSSRAQVIDSTGNTKLWTLRECVEFALANNLDIEKSKYNVAGFEALSQQAKWAMVPSLNAGLTNGYNWGRSINPVTNEFTTQQVASLSPNASSQVTIFNGFRIQNTIKQSGKDVEAARFDLEKMKNDVTLNVINLYINVIFNKELTDNARYQLSSTQQQLERTRKQVAAGALPRSEELNLDAQVATNEVNVITNENSLNLSILQLKQALQLPAATPFDIVVPNDLQVEELAIEKSREEIFDLAKESLPEVKSAYFKVQSATYAVKIARSNLLPRLVAQASINSNYSSANDFIRFAPDKDESKYTQLTLAEYNALSNENKSIIQFRPVGYSELSDRVYGLNYSFIQPTGSYIANGYNEQLSNNVYKSIGISLSIPIFNGFQARLGVRRSLISQRIAEVNAKQINNSLRQNVETAYNDAFAASKSYNSNLRQVQAREEAFRMMKQRFEIGASNYVEYQVSENDLFRAKSDLARAKYNFIFRKKLLDFYQGKPLGL